MLTAYGICSFCDQAVEKRFGSHYETLSWVAAVGGKAATLAEPTKRSAHDLCIKEFILTQPPIPPLKITELTVFGLCPFCLMDVLTKEEAHYEIRSWVKAVGGKGSKLARPTGRFAHSTCVRNRKLGVAPGQGTLL